MAKSQGDSITILLGLEGYKVGELREEGKGLVVEVEVEGGPAPCPHCGGRGYGHGLRKVSQVLHSWSGGKRVFLRLRKRRFRCRDCKRSFTQALPVLQPYSRLTRMAQAQALWELREGSFSRVRRRLGVSYSTLRRLLEREVSQEALHRPVRHVAIEEGVGEGLVRRCVTEEARRLLEAPARPASARIPGLDEFSIKKGQVYDTAVVDLEHKRVMGVISGHRQRELACFFDALPQADQINVVVMDMHDPFRQAVELCLPKAKVVADKFHVLMHVHRALDQSLP